MCICQNGRTHSQTVSALDLFFMGYYHEKTNRQDHEEIFGIEAAGSKDRRGCLRVGRMRESELSGQEWERCVMMHE